MAQGLSSPYDIAPKDDVLAVRQQALAAEADQYVNMMTRYVKERLAECSDGRKITPELKERMKLLVNQEYRVFGVCQTVLKVCRDIEDECEVSADVPAAVLDPLLDELAEYFHDLQDHVRQRKENIDKILATEKKSLADVSKLKSDAQFETVAKTGAWATGGLVGVAVGASIACPITIAAAAAISAFQVGGKLSAADKVQEGLSKDIQRINAPIQYMETLKANHDDTVANADRNRSNLAAGRSVRIKRRVETVLEEVEVLRRSACRNFVALAGSQTLADNFGITEHRRLERVLMDVARDSAMP